MFNGDCILADGVTAPTMVEFRSCIASRDIRNPSKETQYKSANSGLLARIVFRASGCSKREDLADIADAAGIEHTMFVTTDRTFQPEISGGLQLTVRDPARYGIVFFSDGVGINGKLVCDTAFLEAARIGGVTNLGAGLRHYNHLVTNGRWVGHGGYAGQSLAADVQTQSDVAFNSVLETIDGTDPTYAGLADRAHA